MYQNVKIIFNTFFLLLFCALFSLSHVKAMDEPESSENSNKYKGLTVQQGRERRLRPRLKTRPTHKRESSIECLQIVTRKQLSQEGVAAPETNLLSSITSHNDSTMVKTLYTFSKGLSSVRQHLTTPITTPLTTPIATPEKNRSKNFEEVPPVIQQGEESRLPNEANTSEPSEEITSYLQEDINRVPLTLKEDLKHLRSAARRSLSTRTPRKRKSRANSISYERVPVTIQTKEGDKISNEKNPSEHPLKKRLRNRANSSNVILNINFLEFPYKWSKESSPASTPKHRSLFDSESYYERVPLTTSQNNVERLANEGDADAMNDLAILYLKGEEGYLKDEKKAIQWFHFAAEKNHPIALYNLAEAWMNGCGVAKDPSKACIYYGLAANKGLSIAQYKLAICYKNGVGVKRNCLKAFNLFYRAALDGHGPSQYNLALLHEAGEGAPKNDEEALKWILKAAINRLPDASFYLGIVYYYGFLGQLKSISTAKCHLRNAVKRGCLDAQEFLEEIKNGQQLGL